MSLPRHRAARIRSCGSYLRFTSESGRFVPVYSANFRIEGLNGSPSYRQSEEDNGGTHSGSAGGGYKVFDVNSTTATASTTDAGYAYTGAFIFPTASAAIATMTFTGSRSGAASTRFQRPSEGSGLRSFVGIMYLFWPFVMGLVMAL